MFQRSGDQLRTTELRDLLIAVAVPPVLRLAGGRREPELLADDHRRCDRDLAHVLHAAGHDEVRCARQDRLCAKGNRLLARPALAVDGDTGHLFGVPGRQPRRCGRCCPPGGPIASTQPTITSSTARRIDVDAVEQPAQRCTPRSIGMHRRPANRSACRRRCRTASMTYASAHYCPWLLLNLFA